VVLNSYAVAGARTGRGRGAEGGWRCFLRAVGKSRRRAVSSVFGAATCRHPRSR